MKSKRCWKRRLAAFTSCRVNLKTHNPLAAETEDNAAQYVHISWIMSHKSEAIRTVFAAIREIAYKERNARQTCATHEDFLII
jgi:hypothetical protein